MILKFSKTDFITTQMTKEQAHKISEGWFSNVEQWEEDKIKNLVSTTSLAPGKYSDGKRVLKSFEYYQFIMLDFDDPDIIPFKSMQDYMLATYIDTPWCMFTSSRHQVKYVKNGKSISPHDKYRILIPLARTLNRREVEDISIFFFERFEKLDKSTFTPARYFFKGNIKEFCFNLGTKYLDTDKILEEIRSLKKTRNIKSYLKADMIFTTADGEKLSIKDITEKTIVHCPFHEDKNPSAFVDVTIAGTTQLFCSSCQSRQEGTDNAGNYYLKAEDIHRDGITLFWHKHFHAPCYVNKYGEFEKIHIGAEWQNFITLHNLPYELKDTLKRAGVVYEPTLPFGYLDQLEAFNIWKPTPYMKEYQDKIKNDMITFKRYAPLTYAVIFNLCGEREYVEYVLNWFGYLLQTGRQILTSLLFQGENAGIGKDLLFYRIWMPIFGPYNIQDTDGSSIGDRFNLSFMHTRLCRFDECFAPAEYNTNIRRLQWLKKRIGAIQHEIEGKGVDKIIMNAYTAYLLHSNSNHSMNFEMFDRRFTVIQNERARPLIDMPWYKNRTHLEQSIDREVPKVAEYLQSIEIDENMANQHLQTPIKTRMQRASRDELDAFSDSMRYRDLDYFEIETALRRAKVDPLIAEEATEFIEYMIYNHQAIPTEWIDILLMNKLKGQNPASLRRRLGFNGVINNHGRGKYIRISYGGVQHGVYQWQPLKEDKKKNEENNV